MRKWPLSRSMSGEGVATGGQGKAFQAEGAEVDWLWEGKDFQMS